MLGKRPVPATSCRPALAVIGALIAVSCLAAVAVACGPASPSSVPTPEPTTTALPTMTPEPMSTALPSAPLTPPAEAPPTTTPGTTPADTPEAASITPITGTSDPSTDLKIVELDPQYRPLYVDGIEYAAIGPEDHLYLVNVETGQVPQITKGDHPIYQVAFSASHVAWVDSNHIYVVDRATGEEKRITEVSAQRGSLRISGNWLVWMDRRNETGQHYVNFDIYAHNLKTGEELPVAVAPGSQRSPAIHGHTVVWADNRNSPLAGAENRELPSPGCGDCPENRFDIYALDLDTGEKRVLVENGYYNEVPDIYGNFMAWLSYDPERLPRDTVAGPGKRPRPDHGSRRKLLVRSVNV